MSTNDIDLDELDELEAGLNVGSEPAQQSAPKQVKKTETNPVELEEDDLEDGEIVIVNPLEGEGDLKEMLDFDDLDIAIKGQASMFAYYSESAARAQMQYNRAKQNLEQTEARVNHALRNKWNVDKDGKITEKALDARVKMAKAYRVAQECMNDAQYIYKLCSAVVEAFHQREQMLIQTCKRTELEMMTTGSYKSRFGSREERDQKVADALKKRSTAHD